MCEFGEGVKSVVYEMKNKSNGKAEILKVMKNISRKSEIVNAYIKRISEICEMNSKYLLKYNIININSDCILLTMKKCSYNLNMIIESKELFESIDSYELLNSISEGVKELHDNNYIHGNIKPNNIFYDEEINEYILSDFCRNDLFENGEYPITIETIQYISPEMLLNKELIKESDIYSIGLILNYIKRGKNPYNGENISEIMNKILNLEYELIESEFGDELNNLLSELLLKEPKNRLKIDELLEELKSIFINS